MVLVDPHGDLIAAFLGLVPPAARERIVLVGLADTAYPVALNPLDVVLGCDGAHAAGQVRGRRCRHAVTAPGAVATLARGFEDATAVLALPEADRKRRRTTTMVERTNEALHRRERVIRILPHRDSVIRLLGALLMEHARRGLDHGPALLCHDALLAVACHPRPGGGLSSSASLQDKFCSALSTREGTVQNVSDLTPGSFRPSPLMSLTTCD